jgi:hypothetical protein
MPASSCLKHIRFYLTVTIMAGLAVPLHAQVTPSRPNLQLTFRPDLTYNVWPADFDRDGRTDLVAGTATGSLRQRLPADLVIRIGRGDGTFHPARSLGRPALPLGVGDFNLDGFVDIVIREDDAISVLPGRAGAAFGPPRPVGPTNYPRDEVRIWAHVADFDGDGRRDIMVPELHDTLKLYRGNGDLTFQPAVDVFMLGGGYQPSDATSGDFNGDGRRDFAVVGSLAIEIFINTGGLSFSHSVIGGAEFTDITTRDLNNDGRLDLVASSGAFDRHFPYTEPGGVHVLIGNGDGTFQPRITHESGVLGSMSIVVGEFTGDGMLDVATGNRSVVDDGELGRHFWDSLSVFPGNGSGGFLAPTIYAFGTVQPEFPSFDSSDPYQDAHHQLNTSDLNGDHRTDLIASPGVIALSRPPAANRPPVAFAGPDRTDYTYDNSVILRGQGTDPDMHWLTYIWTDEAGTALNYGGLSTAQAYQERGTTRTYTLTVEDGLGGVSSDTVTIYVPLETDPWLGVGVAGGLIYDSIVAGDPHTILVGIYDPDGILTSASVSYSLDDGRTFSPLPGCQNLPPRNTQCVWQNPGPVSDLLRLRLVAQSSGREFVAVSPRMSILASPGGWTSRDVGAVGAAGTAVYGSGGWTIEGSGADIWGTADEFHYVYREVHGNFTVTTRVASIENLDRWVKAGLMIRETLAPGSRHASLFATPRTERGIAFQRRRQTNGISVHTAGPAVAPPGWLTLGRIGDTISAYYRASPTAAWTLVGRETLAGLPASVVVGLAVSSHVDGALATARFDNVRVDTGQLEASEDVGAVGVAGSASFDGVVYDVRASGTDIWGTADAFRIVHHGSSHGPSTEITARVRSLENTHVWAKAGVMFRQSPPIAASPNVMVAVTPGRGVAMQYRAVHGGPSVQVAVRAGIAPEWVRLSQSDGVFRGYASEDGVTWHLIGSVTLDWTGAPALAVTSHNNGTLTRAVFENVRLSGILSQ